MTGTAIRFSETMAGHVGFGELDYHRGLETGHERGNRLMVLFTIEIPDLDQFSRDTHRVARLTGWIGCDRLGGCRSVERGWFNLLVGPDPAGRRQMRYCAMFRDGAGNPVTLVGVKLVGSSGLRVWPETTTLFVRILRGHLERDPDAETGVIASGIISLRPEDFLKQLTSFRATGSSPVARIGAIARFFSLFARYLAQTYRTPRYSRLRGRLSGRGRIGDQPDD